MPQQRIPLETGKFYHIYNRGVDGTNIFRTPENYIHFLSLYATYIEFVADTYAYCLLGNHFHVLVRIKDKLPAYHTLYPDLPETPKSKETISPSRQFSHLFNAYAQSFNKRFGRTGSLFEENFERKLVDSDEYFTRLIQYIHWNPQKHGFVSDFRDYPYSSYHSHLSGKATRLKREAVYAWFGSAKDFEAFHVSNQIDEASLAPYIIEFD